MQFLVWRLLSLIMLECPGTNSGGELAMKKTLLTLFAFYVLSSAALFAQYSSGVAIRDNQAHPLSMPSHPQHAHDGSMAPQSNLYVRTSTTTAQGDRPLWEFERPASETGMPLGDVARLYRQQHATAKKAVKVLEK
jgi:hypothetical protein